MNIKLASRLTGYEIDVYRETENEDNDDIYLDEFKDEIDEWVIESLKNMGLMTAKAVLETNRDILIEKADLEAETVDFVLGVLRSEFDDEATAAQAEASEPKAEEPDAEAPAAE